MKKTTPPASGRITPAMRKRVIERDGCVCQLCGAKKGDLHDGWRKTWILVSHKVKPRFGGATEIDNLEVACNFCHYGGQNIDRSKSSADFLIAEIEKMPEMHQKEILAALKEISGRAQAPIRLCSSCARAATLAEPGDIH